MKKPLIWLLTVGIIFWSGVAVFVFVVSPRIKQTLGGSAVDEWVARQVTRIANAYLVPEVQFDSFTYSHPGVLEMRGARLVAPDAEKTRVVEAKLLRVTLAEVPTFGQPVVIERIDLEGAALRVLRDPATGGFKALVPFVKGENLKDQDRVDAQVQLSTVFRVKKLTLTDGELRYNDGVGPEMMTIKGVSLDLDIEPDSGSGAGWYAVKFEFDRAPVFAVKADARVNIDTLEAELHPLTLGVTLSEEGYAALPPEVQRPLRELDARGTLGITIDGRASVSNPQAANLKGAITLDGFNVGAGDYRVPIDSGVADFTLADGKASFSRFEVKMLTGTASLNGLTAGITDPARPVSFTWNAENLELEDLLRTKTTEGKPPQLAGKFGSTGSATGSLAAMPGSISGGGSVTVRQGRLVNIPSIAQITAALNAMSSDSGALTDEADVDFDLTGEGVSITKGTVTTPMIRARFTGLIRYDQRLDLLANAGPMEKVQSMLGEVGELVGSLTDRLVKYHIGGVLGEPVVEVRPFGL